MPKSRHVRRSLLAFTVVLAAGSCSSGASAKAHSVDVSQKEFSLSVSSRSVAAGSVTVTVDNKGAVTHELVIFRSDLDENSLPLEAGGHKIDEEGAGITHLDPEAEDVATGSSKTITIDLPPGRYVFICNFEDHYKQGMRTVVTSS
jgi:uncharacterized cupredoxin-like copper-binding protein